MAPQWPRLVLISRCRYTVAVGHNIITKEELTESDSVLVYIPIIYYRAYIATCFLVTTQKVTLITSTINPSVELIQKTLVLCHHLARSSTSLVQRTGWFNDGAEMQHLWDIGSRSGR